MPRRLLFSALTLLPTLALAQVPSPKVIERYKQMLQANPAEGTALDRLWQAYAEQGKTGELIDEFTKQSTYPAQMLLGLLLQKAGRTPDAVAALQRALNLDPKNPAPALMLGRIEGGAGNPSQAVIWYRTAVDLIPDSDPRKVDAMLQLGGANLAAGEINQAAEAWEKTIALSPQDLALRRQLADTYVRNHLAPRALPHLQFIQQHGQPQERAQALQQIATIHQAAGAQDEAIRSLEAAIGYTAPGNWLRAELEAQLIRLHQRYHRAAELEAKWKKYAEDNPRDLGGYLQLIGLYERLGDHEQQLAWLDKLILSAPRSVEYRLRRARLLAQMDRLNDAAKAYDELLGSEPRNVELVFERARLDVQRDQSKAAGERITQLLARLNDDEAVRTKALEFYQTNRLYELTERHLSDDARAGGADQLQALAAFYFSRDRLDDARKVLSRLINSADSAEKQAAAWARIAGVLREQNEVGGAVDAIRKAISLHEGGREYHFLLGELESARAHYAGAEVAFERAFALSKTPTEALEADQRLYESLRSQKEPGEDDQRNSPPRPDSAASVTSRAAQAYLLNLIRASVEEPTEERCLRVARWQNWSRNFRGTVDAAERALAINPSSIPAHDFLVQLYASDPQGPGAQEYLRKLMQIDPANRLSYLRRLGQVELQSGRSEEALKIFQGLVNDSPGDIEALKDLALAQQRAEQWNEALTTLQKIHSISPASRKKEAISSLLRVYDRLSLRQPAAELLLAQADLEEDLRNRLTVFGDLLSLCTRHDLLDWLRQQFERRHKVRVDDYFTEVAYGRVLKALGNKAAAFEVLADAVYVSPNPAEALPDLVREAEELNRLDAAIQLQSHLVRVTPNTTPDALLRLADLQEKALKPDDAASTWSKVVIRFPREVMALGRAVDFERHWGTPDRALALLRRIRGIEPENPQSLAALAELCLSEGLTAEAEDALEALLAHTSPEPPESPIRYPAVPLDDASRLEITYRRTVGRRNARENDETLKGLRAFWLQKPDQARNTVQQKARLGAIRQLGELTAAKTDAVAHQRWIDRWLAKDVNVTERLWALYFGRAHTALLDDVSRLMAAKPGDPGPVNAFIWLALQTGQIERLAAWHQEPRRTPPERDYLMIAFEQYLEDRKGAVPIALIQKLFPDGYRMRLWQASTGLGQRGFFREAIQLRERVFAGLKSQRAVCGFELAQWHLMLGQVDDARRVLRGSLEKHGESFSSPTYSVMRALVLLTPKEERAALTKEILDKIDDKSSLVHAALTRALLAALTGDEQEARRNLGLLLEHRVFAFSPSEDTDRSTAATRRWDFILSIGNALQAWRFDQLAVAFWEDALRDSASISLQIQSPPPESDFVRARVLEVRTRMAALKLMRAAPFEVDELLLDYGRYAHLDGLIPLAEILESYGGNSVAIEVYRRAWEREPANPHALREALGACRNGNDYETLEDILTRVVTDGHFRQNDAAHRDLVVQLADAFERKKEYSRAATLLSDLVKSSPHETRFGLKLARLYELGGQTIAAENAYRKLLSVEPSGVATRMSFAAFLDSTNRTKEAIDVLERAAGGEIDARLAELNFKAGRIDEGLAALEKVPPSGQSRAALAVVDLLEKQGDLTKARLLLRAGQSRIKEEAGGYALQKRIIELLPANTDRTEIRREAVRLQRFAENEGIDMQEVYRFMAQQSKRLSTDQEYHQELVNKWSGGKGDVDAGVALFSWQLEKGEIPAAQATWAEIKRNPGADAVAARAASDALSKTENRQIESESLELAARLDPQDYRALGPWMRSLHALGKTAEARKVAEELAARSAFSTELLAVAADAFETLGDVPRARSLYNEAIAADPTGQRAGAHFALARLFSNLKEFGASRQILRGVAQNGAAEIVPPLLEYLKSSGRITEQDNLEDFALSDHHRAELSRAIFTEHLNAGRVAKAVAFGERNPKILDEAMSARLRAAAKKPEDSDAALAWLERWVAQQGGDSSILALMLFDRAETELASLQVEPALTRLQRAHDLKPGMWVVAERLAELRLKRNEPRLAAKVLNAFLAVANDSAERDKARQMLARIPAS
jgi:tetratricopeptide (TPR) repeat protein